MELKGIETSGGTAAIDSKQAVEEVGGALEESLNPIARMASRQRRQQEYLESRQEGDLDITTDTCLLYTSPSPRDAHESRMPSSA